MSVGVLKPEEYFIREEPYYEPVGDEIGVFEAAYHNQLPCLLKGPTGCGKTRFMEHMAWRLKRPLITVSCHDDLTASDLVGRFLVSGGETVWVDGPLARAVRSGGICYLDEIVEARKDTTVVIHPLADDRRVLPMEKLGEVLQAGPEFCLAISYNPGYQSVLKDLKQSTRQRFVALEFDYPKPGLEARIVANETGIGQETDTAGPTLLQRADTLDVDRAIALELCAHTFGQFAQRQCHADLPVPSGEDQLPIFFRRSRMASVISMRVLANTTPSETMRS